MEILMQCPGSSYKCSGCYHRLTHAKNDSCDTPCPNNPSTISCVQLCPDLCANKDVVCEDCVKLSHFKEATK